MNLALTKIEKEVLYRKYIGNGLSSWEANNKIEEFSIHLNKMVKRLSKEKRSQTYIQNRFQKSFEEMIMRLET